VGPFLQIVMVLSSKTEYHRQEVLMVPQQSQDSAVCYTSEKGNSLLLGLLAGWMSCILLL